MYRRANELYEFGDFRLDAEQGILWRGDGVVSLPPKAIELLILLVARRGQVISREEIFETVWAGTFVEDGVLTQNVYVLRNALGKDESGKQFIETVPRVGYRFAGRLRNTGGDFEANGTAGTRVNAVPTPPQC